MAKRPRPTPTQVRDLRKQHIDVEVMQDGVWHFHVPGDRSLLLARYRPSKRLVRFEECGEKFQCVTGDDAVVCVIEHITSHRRAEVEGRKPPPGAGMNGHASGLGDPWQAHGLLGGRHQKPKAAPRPAPPQTGQRQAQETGPVDDDFDDDDDDDDDEVGYRDSYQHAEAGFSAPIAAVWDMYMRMVEKLPSEERTADRLRELTDDAMTATRIFFDRLQ